jgi:hypothetical protein
VSDNTDPDASAEQIAWTEIADAVRAQVLKMIPYMPAMKPEEAVAFVNMIQAAHYVELNARSFDKAVEREKAKTIWE